MPLHGEEFAYKDRIETFCKRHKRDERPSSYKEFVPH